MPTLVLIRHGQSAWNLENRFTGWWDVNLTEQGISEATAAGELMAAKGLDFDICYTSLQTRAIKTLNLALEAMGRLWLPVVKDWRLNERHYGGLTGLNKAEMAAIVPFVQAPVLLDRQPEAAHRFERQVERLDRAGLHAGEAEVEIESARPEQLAREPRLAVIRPDERLPARDVVEAFGIGDVIADRAQRRAFGHNAAFAADCRPQHGWNSNARHQPRVVTGAPQNAS